MYSQTVSDVSKGSYELDLSSYLLVGNTDIYVVATTTDPTTGKKQTRQAFTSVKVVSLSLTRLLQSGRGYSHRRLYSGRHD